MEGEKFQKCCKELLEQVDKQHEVLMEEYKSTVQDLLKLKVEEEMLMEKLNEVMSDQSSVKPEAVDEKSVPNAAGEGPSVPKALNNEKRWGKTYSRRPKAQPKKEDNVKNEKQ